MIEEIVPGVVQWDAFRRPEQKGAGAMASTPRFEREEADAAAAEAAGIGGVSGEEELNLDPAQLPLTEAGGGVAEGFEESERALIEHASHGDQQSAHTILHDQGLPEEDGAVREDAESDHERSSELSDER